LGQAVVAELLEAGARVVATWIHEDEMRRVADALGARDTLELIEADLSSSEGAEAAVAAAGGGDSALAGVVNLVGGYAGSGRLHEAPEGEMERMVELNLMTAHRVTRAALPGMVEQGGGSIVCVGTKATVEPFPGASGYVVSKAAVLSLVRVLAIEYRNDGIRAN